MSKLKSLVLFLSVILILISVTACNNGTTTPQNTDSNNTNLSTNTIFEYYKKVQFGMTKDQVDSILKVTAKKSTQLKNSYSYTNQNNGYGVDVLFNDKNKAYSKTATYPDRKDLSSFFGNQVTQKQADLITKGMTPDQLKSYLGSEGLVISSTKIAFDNNKVSVIRIWVNKDGSMLQVVFGTDDKAKNAIFFES